MSIVSYPMFQPISGCFIKSRLTPIVYNLKPNELTNRFVLVSAFRATFTSGKSSVMGSSTDVDIPQHCFYENGSTYYIC